MSWQEDQDQREDERWRRPGGPGGDWRGLRPTIDNPFTWSVPLGRVAGISIRVHILFVLFVVVVIAQSFLPREGSSFSWLHPPIVLAGLALLLGLVLAHEFGHCLSCRWAGGAANEVLMWPLGGLAFCRPPNRWRSHLATAMGGPFVNLLVCLVAGTWLGLLTGEWLGVAVPNPLQLYGTLLDSETVASSWSTQVLFLINWCSFVLLVFNLLPIFPLDGGRMLQALLWSRLGYVRSMRVVVRTGYFVAVLLGLGGVLMGARFWPVVGIAALGIFVCWDTQKKLEFTEAVLADAGQTRAGRGGGGRPDPRQDRGIGHGEPQRPGEASPQAGDAASPRGLTFWRTASRISE
jgi:Zn-dependent protease